MKIRWRAWYGDEVVKLSRPAGWQVQTAQMSDAPAIEKSALLQALRNPIASPALAELAARSQKAVLVVEDITRPAPTAEILPMILNELISGGLTKEDIFLMMGLGAHAPMYRPELILKLGREIVENYPIHQNNVYDNQAYLGDTQRGTPVYFNRTALQADLRISVGTISPHGSAGFSSGVKTAVVGLAGIETLNQNHALVTHFKHPMLGQIEDNVMRADLEEIGRMIDLRFIVNTVVNTRREIAHLVAGDPLEAHRAGVAVARKIYSTQLPPPADIVIFNTYPKDTDLVQVGNAFNAAGRDLKRVLKPDGTAVIISACPQGAGFHYLYGYGMRRYVRRSRERLGLGKNGLIFFSPNLSYADIEHFPDDSLLFQDWDDVITELQARHGDEASVTLFPNAAIQIPADIAARDSQQGKEDSIEHEP